MTSASLIPDRLRNHFALNGGRRPTKLERYQGHKGIDAARAVLDKTTPPPPADPHEHVHVPLTGEQIERAHKGIDAARHILDDVGQNQPLN